MASNGVVTKVTITISADLADTIADYLSHEGFTIEANEINTLSIEARTKAALQRHNVIPILWQCSCGDTTGLQDDDVTCATCHTGLIKSALNKG